MKFDNHTREARERKKIIDTRVEQFQKDNNIEIKCISDKTLLYIRYILDQLEQQRDIKFDDKFKTLVNRIYKETRGNSFEIGVSKPSLLAIAIIYMASNIFSKPDYYRLLYQNEIALVLGSKNTNNIRAAFHKLTQFIQKQGLSFD